MFPTRRRPHPWLPALTVILTLALAGTDAFALINLSFTPVHLVSTSGLIASVKIGPIDKNNDLPAQNANAIKGKLPAGGLSFTLGKTSQNRIAELHKAIGDDKALALLFVGRFKKGFLHVGSEWFPVAQEEQGQWEITEDDTQHIVSVWNGGTEMLLRAVECIQADPKMVLPAVVGVKWDRQYKVATITGKVSAASAVDLGNDGHLSLFIAADAGDHLFACAAGGDKLTDVTANRRLASKSKMAAWGRYVDSPRPSLVSWDGASLTLWTQAEDRTFSSQPMHAQIRSNCLGLTTVDLGVKGRAGVLVSTTGGLLLLKPQTDGSWASAELPAAPAQAELGPAGASVITDFDGDGIADILQPFGKAAVLRRGKPDGNFGSPQILHELAAGEGRFSAVVGDFVGDGILDVVTAGDGGYGYFANDGHSKFRDTSAEVGEAVYKVQRNVVGISPCDLNNDGRLDLVLLYKDAFPQLYFGRGFRTFGMANSLKFEDNDQVPDTDKGQQAGAMADFSGTDNPSLALVLANGDLWHLITARDGKPETAAGSIGLIVTSGAEGPVGPTTVTAYYGQRCLGARLVTPGMPGNFRATAQQELRLEYKLSDGATRRKSVTLSKSGMTTLSVDREPATRSTEVNRPPSVTRP